jgi:hypothetical protein
MSTGQTQSIVMATTDDDEGEAFSCFRLDHVLDRLVWDVESSPGQREVYLVSFGTCDNPPCDCRALELWLQPFNPSGPSGGITHLQLMLETQEVHCTVPEGPRDRRLAQELSTRLNAEDWVLAQRIYESEKADVSEPANASNLQISFPEDVLEDPTVLMQYQDVFPYARRTHFELGGKFFVVFERYCSNPICSCTEVQFDIAPTPPPVRWPKRSGPPQVTTDKDVTEIVFDYQTGKAAARSSSSAVAASRDDREVLNPHPLPGLAQSK